MTATRGDDAQVKIRDTDQLRQRGLELQSCSLMFPRKLTAGLLLLTGIRFGQQERRSPFIPRFLAYGIPRRWRMGDAAGRHFGSARAPITGAILPAPGGQPENVAGLPCGQGTGRVLGDAPACRAAADDRKQRSSSAPPQIGSEPAVLCSRRWIICICGHSTPALIEAVRRGDYLVPLPDGTAGNVRWVPTKDGVALGFLNCAACHRLKTASGDVIDGAPSFAVPGQRTGPPGPAIVSRAHAAQRYVDGGSPIQMGPAPFGMWLYSAFGVPWLKDDVHAKLKDISQAEFAALFAAGLRGGAIPVGTAAFIFRRKCPT